MSPRAQWWLRTRAYLRTVKLRNIETGVWEAKALFWHYPHPVFYVDGRGQPDGQFDAMTWREKAMCDVHKKLSRDQGRYKGNYFFPAEASLEVYARELQWAKSTVQRVRDSLLDRGAWVRWNVTAGGRAEKRDKIRKGADVRERCAYVMLPFNDVQRGWDNNPNIEKTRIGALDRCVWADGPGKHMGSTAYGKAWSLEGVPDRKEPLQVAPEAVAPPKELVSQPRQQPPKENPPQPLPEDEETERLMVRMFKYWGDDALGREVLQTCRATAMNMGCELTPDEVFFICEQIWLASKKRDTLYAMYWLNKKGDNPSAIVAWTQNYVRRKQREQRERLPQSHERDIENLMWALTQEDREDTERILRESDPKLVAEAKRRLGSPP